MLSPDDIEAREFLVSLRGYDRDEVGAFLSQVADEVRSLQARVADVHGGGSPAAAAPAAAAAREGGPGDMFAEIGMHTQRILEAAQEAGTEIRRKAEQDAERELQEARRGSMKLIAEGERRREAIEREVAALEAARNGLVEDLRSVARALEQALRDLAPRGPATTVREALASETAAEATAGAEEPDDAEAPQRQPASAAVVAASDAEATTRVAEATQPAGPEPTEPLALRAQALGPLHPKLVRALKRGLQDLQNLALDRVRRIGADADLDRLLPTAEEVDALAAVAVDFLRQAWQHGVAAAAALAGAEQATPAVRQGLEERFGKEASERLTAQLGATLRMGLSGGEDAAALSDRVGAVFAELKGPQAEELAANHLISAYEVGLLDTWSASGIVQRRWVLGKEPRCPEGRCRSNDQSGAVDIGNAFPSGHDAPPVHVGCTCTTMPVS